MQERRRSADEAEPDRDERGAAPVLAEFVNRIDEI